MTAPTAPATPRVRPSALPGAAPQAPSGRARDGLRPALLRVLVRAGLPGLFALHRQRRNLAKLDARLLRDIGVSPGAAGREGARPPWDVPSTWLR